MAPCSCAQSCARGKTGVGRPAQPARGMPRAHGANGPAHPPRPSPLGISVSDGKSVGFPSGKRGQIRFPAENGSDPGSDLAFVFCSSFFNPGWTRTETVRGREGGLRRGVRGMDAAAKPPGTGSRRPLRAPPSRSERRKSAAFRDHPEGLRRWLDTPIPRKRKRPSTGPGRSRRSGQAGIRIPASPRRPVRLPSGDHLPCGGPAGQPGPGQPVQRRAAPRR